MRKIFLLLHVLILTSIVSWAESGPAFWYDFELSKKVISGLTFEFSPALRLAPGFERDKYIIDCGVEYKFHKALVVAGSYRYYNEKKKNEDEIGHRYAFDIKSGYDVQRFKFQARLRYLDYFNAGNLDDAMPVLRYRIKAAYEIKNSGLLPYTSIEFFHDFQNKELYKRRYTTGVKYDLNKKNELSLFYRIQDATKNTDLLHIVGVAYQLKI